MDCFSHKERNHGMRKDVQSGYFVLASALVWLSVIPGRAGAS